MKDKIKRANESDLVAIREWLEREKHERSDLARRRRETDSESEIRKLDSAIDRLEGNFLCNFNWLEESCAKRQMLVAVDECGAPAGFLAGLLQADTILQVRGDLRGKGIGRKLVRRRLQALGNASRMLRIECAPRTSVPFWKKLGFDVHDADAHGRVYGYRVEPRRNAVPASGVLVQVSIVSYPQSKKWHKDTPPVTAVSPAAYADHAGVIHLAERVYIFEAMPAYGGNAVVEILISGERLYFDKAKYQEAAQRGVNSCTNGFFIDRIVPKA